VRTSDPSAERGRCLHARVSGLGSGYELCQPKSDAGAGTDCERAWSAAGDPLRQWAGDDQPALSSVVYRATDRVGAYPTGKADAERASGKFQWADAGRMSEPELVSESVRRTAQDRGLAEGGRSTTKNVRTAAWDTKRRKNLRRHRQQASTQLCERQGIQTPSLAPRAPPSRLKPDSE